MALRSSKRFSLTEKRENVRRQIAQFSTSPSPSREDEINGDCVETKYWKLNGKSGRYQRPIFVAATKQHVGKTSVSLALMSGLKKRYDKVGFIKPVGQQHVEVKSASHSDSTIRVDKDVCLMKDHFELDHIDYQHMSPVIIPPGYTKDYIDGKISLQNQVDQVISAFGNVSDASDVVLCEGTGHCAVGSIVQVNNAKVASLIGADMILIANGGLGKPQYTIYCFFTYQFLIYK